MSKSRKIVTGFVIVVILCVAGLFVYGAFRKDEAEETGKKVTESAGEDTYVSYNGAKYEYN